MSRRIPPQLMPFVLTNARDQLRYMATSRPALSLSPELRRAAARDPGLEWHPETHRYRRVRVSKGGE